MSICLDSRAVLAWLDGDEPAAEHVEAAFDEERPWMNWLNLGEVAYQVERRHGRDECFAAATAVARSATLYTGDPELLDRDVGCRVRDLRR